MHSTHLRKEHIHGALLGTAIGESLAVARTGLKRRAVLRHFGRRLEFSRVPGGRIYGDQSRLMMINAQALLNSRSELGYLKRAFCWRLGWYVLSWPTGIRGSTLQAGLRSWLSPLRISSGVHRADAGAATRAVFSTLAINGCGHRLQRWIEESTKLTHTHEQAIASCRLLAVLIDYGVSTSESEFDGSHALQTALEQCSDAELKECVAQLLPFLQAGLSARSVARRLGWRDGIVGLVPTTTMAVYCWLRHPYRFERALRAALTLGGDAEMLGAIVGGLSGANLGQAGIPDPLRERLGGWPHGTEWMDALAKRFSHWPHGVDDLHRARAEDSDPLLQVVRNVRQWPPRIVFAARRIVWRGG